MSDGRPKTDPPTEAHDSNRLGGEEPPYYAAAADLDALDTDLTNHSNSTGGVHGVDEDDTVAGQADVDAVTSDLNDHAGSTSGVHGVGGSNVESEAGAQSKADTAESNAKGYTDDHEEKGNPHSNSETPSGAQQRVDDHEDKSNPHSGSAAVSQLYDDDQARSAVDGSDVTVENAVIASEAGNADTVDGRHAADIDISTPEDGFPNLTVYGVQKGGGSATVLDITGSGVLVSGAWVHRDGGGDMRIVADGTEIVVEDFEMPDSNNQALGTIPPIRFSNDLLVEGDGGGDLTAQAVVRQ